MIVSPFLDYWDLLTEDSFEKIIKIATEKGYGFFNLYNFKLFTYFYDFFGYFKIFNNMYISNFIDCSLSTKLKLDTVYGFNIYLYENLGTLITKEPALVCKYPSLKAKFEKIKYERDQLLKKYNLDKSSIDLINLIFLYL